MSKDKPEVIEITVGPEDYHEVTIPPDEVAEEAEKIVSVDAVASAKEQVTNDNAPPRKEMTQEETNQMLEYLANNLQACVAPNGWMLIIWPVIDNSEPPAALNFCGNTNRKDMYNAAKNVVKQLEEMWLAEIKEKGEPQ